MKRAEKKLLQKLKSANLIVGYDPIGDEPAFDEYVREAMITIPEYRTSPDKSVAPENAVQELSVIAGSGDAVLFLPGRAFDRKGTRHGRGGGWYDRFLSMIPDKWVRVGVTNVNNISVEVLERKPWDEPVDYILAKNAVGWEVLETPRAVRKT